MNSRYLVGVLACLFAVLSWGGMFPIMGSALHVVNPFVFTAIRYTLAGALFIMLLGMREGLKAFRPNGRLLGLWVLGSLGFAGFGFLVFLGQKMAGASGTLSASVVMALMPMLSVLVNWVWRGIKPKKTTLAFIALSFCGVLLVVTKGDLTSVSMIQGNLSADLSILIGALCWVIYTIGASMFPGWSPLRYTAMTTAAGVPTILLVNVLLSVLGMNDLPSFDGLVSIAPQMTYMVLVAGLGGVLCWNIGNKIVTPINGVLFMDIVPTTTFIIAAVQGYQFNTAELSGAALTGAALVLNNLYQRSLLKATPAKVTRNTESRTDIPNTFQVGIR